MTKVQKFFENIAIAMYGTLIVAILLYPFIRIDTNLPSYEFALFFWIAMLATIILSVAYTLYRIVYNLDIGTES
jgi:hypothetical protein